MKLAHIVGARPQFIKAAMVSRALRAVGVEEILIHTGQHYDDAMSAVFFEELELPKPDYHFTVQAQSPAAQTGEMVSSLEGCLADIAPERILVHGDTNSTLAGALVAKRLHIPLAHNEAGLRSFNLSMPEEHNRIIADQCASLLFCPSEAAKAQLALEGIKNSVHVTGDVMYDAAMHYGKAALELGASFIPDEEYALLTIHRAYTADHPERLSMLISLLADLPMRIVFPMHPRTAARIEEFGLAMPENVTVLDPVGYFEMLALEQRASWILTDSGGVQKEAYYFAVPCITLRSETEWTETVDAGWNIVTDLGRDALLQAMESFDRSRARPPLFGDGRAAEAIARILSTVDVE